MSGHYNSSVCSSLGYRRSNVIIHRDMKILCWSQCYDCRLTHVFMFLNGTIQYAPNRLWLITSCSSIQMFLKDLRIIMNEPSFHSVMYGCASKPTYSNLFSYTLRSTPSIDYPFHPLQLETHRNH